jgi:putative ABC transport system permease protein
VLLLPGGRCADGRETDAGIITGAAATASYAHDKGWATVIPTDAWAGGLTAAILIGALAGLLPAIRAARLPPTQALWSL